MGAAENAGAEALGIPFGDMEEQDWREPTGRPGRKGSRRVDISPSFPAPARLSLSPR